MDDSTDKDDNEEVSAMVASPMFIFGAVVVIAVFLILFIPILQGDGNVGVPGVPGITTKKFISCDVSIETKAFGFADLKTVQCSRGNACFGTIGSLVAKEGSLKITTNSGASATTDWREGSIFGDTTQVNLKVCAPETDTRVTVTLFDKDKVERDVEVVTVA